MNSGASPSQVQVSYVIASYNHAKYVGRMLDSIRADAPLDCEVLVLDDGSTDDSATVIGQWISAHPEMKVRFIQRPNKGLAATLNELIAEARGEFIRPCSSDDELIAGSTAFMVAHLRNAPRLAAVFGDGVVIDTDGRTIHESVIRFGGGSIRRYQKDVARAIISDWAVSGPLILFRGIPFGAERPYDESLAVEDWYLYSKLAAKGAIGFVPNPCVRYRIHGTNVSKTRDTEARIRNLSSQLAGATRNLALLSGGLRLLMLSEIALLKAKLHYLRRRFLFGVPYLLSHCLYGGVGRLVRAIEPKRS
jgi:glycosyltransferase involved in cell wall biosynthesis